MSPLQKKNKTGNTSDKSNYRPIAFVTAASTIFELCLSVILEDYLFTHDQKFGFRSKHSADFCIFTMRSVSKYYTQQHSPAYTCFLDVSKAFDKINHFKLFRKLLDRKTPIVTMRILLFWYSKQTVCIKPWRCISGSLFVSNSVRQGRILLPKLFSVYIDGVSDKLVKYKVGCYINNLCMNHVMYDDDICLMAPSPASFARID